MADVNLPAMLAAIRENAEGLTVTHFDDDCEPGTACTAHEAIWMANALEAVLNEHRQSDSDTGWCQNCDFSWPCSTVQAITRELTGEADNG